MLTSFMHMHLRGSKGYTHVIRNGTQLAPITNMDYFDFNYQNINYLPNDTVIYPGDILTTECHWNTIGVDVDTDGGYA